MNPEEAKEMLSKMSDEERRALAEKMDKELDAFIDGMESSSAKYMDGWTEENWEKEMEEHPLFTSKFQGEGDELSPLMRGIQELKYSPDENTPEDLAKNYKEDGNFNFKLKKYRFAIAAYSEGLKQGAKDEQVNVQLLTNRAAAQFRIGNYRSSLIDCRLALKRVPDHAKALVRGAQCCLKLGRFQECRELCDRGLEAVPDDKGYLDMRAESSKAEKEAERNRRREAAAEKKKKGAEARLLDAIRRKGVTLQSARASSATASAKISLEDLEPLSPAAVQRRVHFAGDDNDEDDRLVWPVMFLYPEYGQSDFIEAFEEDQTFSDHLEAVFAERPPWDAEGKYRAGQVKIYFEDLEKNKLVEVEPTKPLMEILSDKRYRVVGGTPGFILLADKSKFQSEFRKKYE